MSRGVPGDTMSDNDVTGRGGPRQPGWKGALAAWVSERGWDLRVCTMVAVAGAITGAYTLSEVNNDQVPAATAVILAVLIWLIALLFAVAGWAVWSAKRRPRPRTGASGFRWPGAKGPSA